MDHKVMTMNKPGTVTTVVPFTKPTRYIACPRCGEGEYEVSHLRPGADTAWYCDDCGYKFRLQVHDPISITLTVLDECHTPTLVTLRSTVPVTLLIKGRRLVKNGVEVDDAESDHYYYEDCTCPINYLQWVEKVVDDEGDMDPHGIFTHVKTEPWREL